MQVASQKILVQPDKVVIVLVDVPPENHAHHKKAVLNRQQAGFSTRHHSFSVSTS
jgi:hypothetical protein